MTDARGGRAGPAGPTSAASDAPAAASVESDPLAAGSAESDPLAVAAARRPAAVAVEGASGRAWTYADLDEAAGRVAAALRDLGAGPGRRVAVLARPSPDGIAAVHGVLRAGATLAPAHPRWSAAEGAAFLAAVRPVALVAERALEEPPIRAPDGDGDGAGLVAGLGRDDGLRVAPAGGDAAPPGPGADSARTLLWTSGTSGGARGVCLSLKAHRASARGAAERLALGPDDRWLASLSLAHVGGLALVLRAAWVGCRVVGLPGGFDAAAVLGLAADGRVTHASVVPVMLRRLLDASAGPALPGALRCLLVGGAATPPGLLDRALAAGAPVALTYGLTEAASQVATAPPALVRRRPGTVGPPLPGTELRIAGDGEILVRGPTLMEGYLVPGRDGGSEEDGEDGWLRTGDTGRLDDEGHLWVTGRLSGRIVTGGLTVDPAEVERALEEHPGLAEAAVVGIPDEEWGERVAAAIVPTAAADREEAAGDHGLRAALETFARERLSAGRRPRLWVPMDALPRNPNGKVDRAEVRRRIEAAAPAGSGGAGPAPGGARGAGEPS